MKTIATMAAVALCLGAGAANATGFLGKTHNELNAEMQQKMNQRQQQQQKQAQGQLQGQQQKASANNDNRDSVDIKHDAAATSGSLGLGAASFGAAASQCWGLGVGYGFGFGGTGGTVPGTGSGLFNYSESGETYNLICGIDQATLDLYDLGREEEAAWLECVNPWKRMAKNAIRQGACDDAPVATKIFIRADDDENIYAGLDWNEK